MSQRSMEVKVGVLIVVALGLLAGFVVVMGGLSFQPTYTINVDFDNPGGLKAGAPVRIAGVKIGRVAAVDFRGGKVAVHAGEREPLIRVVASLENQFKASVYEN
jgi:phospholipid/cholesterol/gamma-HCH transport system substrate-binding protein